MNRRSAAALLRNYEARVRDDEIRGSMHPDDRDYIHHRYLKARERLIQHLMEKTNG